MATSESTSQCVTSGHGDASSKEIALRIAAWSSSGMHNVEKPLLGRPPLGEEVLLNGGCGETLRTAYPFSSRFASKAEAVRASSPTWASEAPRSCARRCSSTTGEEMHRVLFDALAPERQPSGRRRRVFFMRQRLRRWLGTAQELDASEPHLPAVLDHRRSGSRSRSAADNRHAEWVHLQLMQAIVRTAGPHLLRRRRLARGPHERTRTATSIRRSGPVGPVDSGGLAALAVVPRPHREENESADGDAPCRRAPSAGRAASRHRSAGRAPHASVPARRPRCRDASSSSIVTRCEQSLDRFAGLGEVQKAQLYGALTAAIWLGGHEIALPRGIGDYVS